MKNIVISNEKKLENLKKLISKDGVEKLHVLTDFDRTLTTIFVNGKKVPSLISILRNENYLTPDYSGKAKKLYDKYYPIEVDPNIPMEKKKKEMNKWWTAHFDLLIESGLNKKDIQNIVKSKKVKLRNGFSDFNNILRKNNIPLVIMSACGLGVNAISMFLEEEGELYDNVHIISNLCEWDKNGNVINFKKPIIHVMNKNETELQDFPFFEKIKNRKNVLLLGDSMGDIEMVDGFDYDNLIKIGFLNDNIEKSLEIYKKNYDILILNNSSMDYVNDLFREIIN
jgi:5'-nucleotidase